MAIQSKAELEKKLTESARRARQIREAAEKIKGAALTTETETTPSPVTLIQPAFSPLGKAER